MTYKIGVLFNEEGLFAGDCLEGMEIPEGYILFEGDVPDGLYLPKLIDGEVVEGAEFDVQAYGINKINELWDKCNQDIESGFLSSATGTEHLYGFDTQDRENILGTLSLMNAIPAMTHVEWKPKGTAPFLHTREQFLLISQDAFTHKQSKINRYWALRGQVETAEDKESIDNIQWT